MPPLRPLPERALPPIYAEPAVFAPALAAARALRDAGDLAAASSAYRALLTERDDPGLWVELGHVARDAGEWPAAEAAYRRALTLTPKDADPWRHLGDLLKRQGRRDAAVDALAEALRLDPRLSGVRRELIHLGARDALPVEQVGRSAVWAQSELAGLGYPLAAYDRFRRDIPIRPPPGALPMPAQPLTVVIDGVGTAPALLRATLRGLTDQSVRQWRAFVVADAAIRAHPVAGFAAIEPRIALVDASPAEQGPRLIMIGGTVLHPEAIAWLLFAMSRSNAATAVTCDQDRAIADAHDLRHVEPSLSGAFDPDLRAVSPAPAALLVREAPGHAAGTDTRALLAAAAARGPVAHVPRILASGLAPVPVQQSPRSRPPVPTERMLVVIQTRDEAALLAACLDSLRRLAERPELIDLLVVDNGSHEPATAELLDYQVGRHGLRFLPLAEPFNWSRANNLAVEDGTQPILVFVNNDIELLSAGWDAALAAALQPGVGAVGARLLYPDRTVQHAGIVFGVDDATMHEGRHQPFDAAGPGGRWHVRHRVAAVTGAFMAVRRADFVDVGGFDADDLFVGYSDVDLCLKLRERGRTIVYEPAIEAIHHESQTRGLNDTPERAAWDAAELGSLHERWGRAIVEDIGVNPQWARGGQPFDGLREPTLREIVRFIDATARSQPWRPTRRAEQAAAEWLPDAML